MRALNWPEVLLPSDQRTRLMRLAAHPHQEATPYLEVDMDQCQNGGKLPLTLWQVLEEEYVSMYGNEAAGTDRTPALRLCDPDAWLFDVTDLVDLEGFARRLRESKYPDSTDRLSREILDSLPEEEHLQVDHPLSPPLHHFKETLVQSLNRFLRDQGLFSRHFAGSGRRPPLPDRIQRLIDAHWKGNAFDLEERDLQRVNRLLLEHAFPGELAQLDEKRLRHIYGLIHAKRHAALCLSGGGIRSASFALGILQGLARYNLLDRFRYLSTVSGGGYIGSWLSAWTYHHPQGLQGVARELASTGKSLLDPEPETIRHLRKYSNYLSPKLGFFSADTWTLVATYLRNLLLNWLYLIPLLTAVLVLPRAYVVLLGLNLPRQGAPLSFAQQGLTYGLGLLGFLLGATAVAYFLSKRPSVQEDQGGPTGSTASERRKGVVFVRQPLFLATAFLLLAAVLLTLFWGWHRELWKLKASLVPELWRLMGFGISLLLLSWLFYALICRRIRWVEFGAALGTGAVAGLSMWFMAKVLLLLVSAWSWIPQSVLYATFAVPLAFSAFLIAATLFVGLSSRWTDDEDREWWARSGAWVLIVVMSWLVLNGLVFFGPLLVAQLPKTVASIGGLSGLITIILGRSAMSPAQHLKNGTQGWQSLVLGKGLAITALLFLVSLIALLSLGTSLAIAPYIQSFGPKEALCLDPSYPVLYGRHSAGCVHLQALHYAPWYLIFPLLIALPLFGNLMDWAIDFNRFSLHAMYRSRLIRSYPGASNPDRNPNPSTGFDPKDNLYMHELWPKPGTGASKPLPLLHVANLTMNLVRGKWLAWQQRKAAPFAITPLHAGCPYLGYRPARPKPEYENRCYGGRRGMSLGTAMTISGAAASPNMGYHSSPVVTLLMTLFNVRLGSWLGNPGPAGGRTYYRQYPPMAAPYLVAEALGLTDDRKGYVYLSDGGHFENLGLYEMVLRRCALIVVSDASCDSDFAFEDLGNAIHKIRVDLGIPIEFPHGIPIHPVTSEVPLDERGYVAFAKIHYSLVDRDASNGTLIYIKPSLCGREPPDISHYQRAHSSFPHESTVDQWFGETQFESYRMLGCHIVDDVLAKRTPHLQEDELGSKTLHITRRLIRQALESLAKVPSTVEPLQFKR